MSAAHTSAALAARLHELARDVPGYSACEAHTRTRREATNTTYFAHLTVTVNGCLRQNVPTGFNTEEEAIEDAFDRVGKSLDSVRPKQKEGPKPLPKALPRAPQTTQPLYKKTG